jgi:hypothetical protein
MMKVKADNNNNNNNDGQDNDYDSISFCSSSSSSSSSSSTPSISIEEGNTSTTKDGTLEMPNSNHPSNNQNSSSKRDIKNNNNNNTNNSNEMTHYTATENKLINRWRWVVIVSILVVGAIVCSITYITLHKGQINDCQNAVCKERETKWECFCVVC